jgi:hypothetical protein
MAEATQAAYCHAALPTVTVASERPCPAVRIIALLALGHSTVTSIIQPLFGYLSDRTTRHRLLPLSLGLVAARVLPAPRSS